ncbi:MAG: sulfate transporter, rane protein CysW, partial [Verrucomicrobiota bacterium]
MKANTTAHVARIGKKAIPRTYQAVNEPPWMRRLLITLALVFIGFFLVLPLVAVFTQAFAKGWETYLQAVRDENTLSAIKMTLLVAAV